MINYMLPGFYEHFSLYKNLFYLKETCPEYFKDNINISCLYGNF